MMHPWYQLNWIDYAILGLMLFSVLISTMRGFVKEALSLATWILAIWIGLHFSPYLAALLGPRFHSPIARSVLSFLGLFVSTLILGTLLSYLVSEAVENIGLGRVDHLVGSAFGVARGVLSIGVLLLVANMTNFKQTADYQKSVFLPHFQGLAVWLHEYLPAQKQPLEV